MLMANCNLDDSQEPEQYKVLKLDFNTFDNKKTIKQKSSSRKYEMLIKLNEPLEINSDFLELKKSYDKNTNKITYFILEKKGVVIFEKNTLAAKVTVRYGYQHDGGNCWIAGTYYEDNVTGVSLFYPASPVAQVISNVCGWPYSEIA